MRKKQTPSSAPRVPTLADVLICLETSGDLSPVRIRDLHSAISRMCALIGEEPDQIALDRTTSEQVSRDQSHFGRYQCEELH
jgi:hypothetical protein